MSTNPIESTDQYLEFLAGRRKQPPVIEDADRDIIEAAQLLRSLKNAPAPSKRFSASLKNAVMQSRNDDYVAKRETLEKRPSRLFLPGMFKFGVPALVAIAAVLVFVAVPRGFWSNLFHNSSIAPYIAKEANAATVSLRAVNQDASGIDPATHFILTAKDGSLSQSDVEKNFALSPTIAFTVTKKSDTEYEIIPTQPFAINTVYAATFAGIAKTETGGTEPRTYSWAFQVRTTFQVIGTLPRDRATNVAMNTGIEFTFSDPGVTAQQFKSHFTISPAVAGTVEVHNRTISFVPSKKLSEKTVYTVTVAKGLKVDGIADGLASDTVIRFETAAADTNADTGRPLSADNIFQSVVTGSPIVFSRSNYPVDMDSKPYEYTFTVYQYASLDDFTSALTARQLQVTPWAVYANNGIDYPTKGLKKIGTYKTEAKDGIVTLGTGFTAGAYLADSTSNGAHSQIPFVVSDLSAYTLTTVTDSLVWLNNMVTQQPVHGATIAVPSANLSVTSDANGLARFATPDAMKNHTAPVLFATVHDGSNATVVPLEAYDYVTWNVIPGISYSTGAYWSYLSTDRDMYQPTDTVHFWGVAKNRDTGAVPSTVHIDFAQRSSDGRYASQILKSFDVTPSAMGTYMGTIVMNGVATGGYPDIVASVNGEMISDTSFAVETYKKPPYQVTITPNTYAIIAGDPLSFDVSTTFFDGTPAPNIALKREDLPNAPKVTTDSNGHATYTISDTTPGNFWGYLGLVPVEPSDGDVRGAAYVTVYPAQFQINAQASMSGHTITLTGSAQNVHPELADPTAADPLGRVVSEGRPGQTIEGSVIVTKTRQIENGVYYDYLAKQTYTNYSYETYNETVSTFTVTTGRNGAFTKTFTVDPKQFYHIDLKATDSRGTSVEQTTYAWLGATSGASLSGGQLAYIDTAQEMGKPTPLYGVGDTATTEIIDGNGPLAEKDGQRFLFVGSQRGLRSAVVQSSPVVTHTFAEQDIPSYTFRAVVFSSKGIEELYGPALNFKQATRELKISVTPDKPGYAPGDTARLSIHVTDANGVGQQARVNVSAIDEAIVQLQGGNSNGSILSTLYEPVGEGVLGTYVSNKTIDTAVGAEKGGGGGDDRIDFKDTALYTEITTDASGNGTATFSVPDNLTSWNVTTQAVTGDLKAGSDNRLILVKKPLFVLSEFPDRILAQDHESVTARAFGTALKTNDSVTFTFSVVGNEASQKVVTGTAFAASTYELPKLAVGDYQVRVHVDAHGMSDAVVLPLHVLASSIVQRTVTTSMLDAGQTPILSTTGSTELRFADADRLLAYDTLWGLLNNPYARLDDTVAARLATDTLHGTFNDSVTTASGDPSAFMADGGLALYASGSPDVEYGALAAADSSFMAQPGQLAGWFQSVLDNKASNTEQVAYALYGLAQLHQPVLPEIRALVALKDLPDRERLTAALALEALGADDEARPIASYLADRYGSSQDQYFHLTLGNTNDERIVSTARFAILAAGLQMDQRYGTLQYVAAHQPKDTSTHLEQALAVQRLLAHAGTASVTVTYRLDGTETTKTIGPSESFDLVVDPVQATTFAITGHSGNISVSASTWQPFDVSTAPHSNQLTVTRRYSVDGKETTSFKRGDIVRIDLSWSKKGTVDGTRFGVVDILPTGLRPVTNPWLFGNDDKLVYPYAIEYNRVKFYADQGSFYYLARAVDQGTAIAEPAMIQAFDAPSNVAYSASGTITIK